MAISVQCDTCFIFEVGRTPASPTKYLGFLGGGGLLILAGAGAMFVRRD